MLKSRCLHPNRRLSALRPPLTSAIATNRTKISLNFLGLKVIVIDGAFYRVLLSFFSIRAVCLHLQAICRTG